MSDILIVTWDGGGNVVPAVKIAGELARRGHTIRFLGNPSQAEGLAAQGFDVVDTHETVAFSARNQASLRSLLRVFGDHGMARDLLAAVRQRQPDLIMVDCMLMGAQQGAYESGVPYVVLEHLYETYYEQGCLRSPLALALRARGLRPRVPLEAAAARLVTAVPELDQVRSDRRPHNLQHIGPTVDWTPRTPIETGQPVLISLSTVRFPGLVRSMQRILDATEQVGVEAVLTTGPALDPTELRIPSTVQVHRYVPHGELMGRMSMLIGHGGHGTTMQGLAHDLPVMVMPLGPRTDQPWVARSVVDAGAGRLVRRSTGPTAISARIAELISDGPHRAAAREVGDAVRRSPGVENGADAIEGILSRESDRGSRRSAGAQ